MRIAEIFENDRRRRGPVTLPRADFLHAVTVTKRRLPRTRVFVEPRGFEPLTSALQRRIMLHYKGVASARTAALRRRCSRLLSVTVGRLWAKGGQTSPWSRPPRETCQDRKSAGGAKPKQVSTGFIGVSVIRIVVASTAAEKLTQSISKNAPIVRGLHGYRALLCDD
jgi:hypothetical protein